MPTHFATRIFTKFFGEEIGSDELGNKYYRRDYGPRTKEKRWVIYRDKPDGSAVPPEWQGSVITCDFRANRVAGLANTHFEQSSRQTTGPKGLDGRSQAKSDRNKPGV